MVFQIEQREIFFKCWTMNKNRPDLKGDWFHDYLHLLQLSIDVACFLHPQDADEDGCGFFSLTLHYGY